MKKSRLRKTDNVACRYRRFGFIRFWVGIIAVGEIVKAVFVHVKPHSELVMLKSLNTIVAVSDMQRGIHGVVNKAVLADKKHRAFRVSQGGIKAFYQSVSRPFGVGNRPENQGRLRAVGACVGGKRIKRLLAGWRQKGFALLDVANAKGCDDVAAFKNGVQGDVSVAVDLDGHKKAFDHGCAPVVVEGSRTARSIWRALYVASANS